jgi:recombination protein RecA
MMTVAADIVKALKKLKLDVSLLSADDSPCTVDAWISTGCVALDVIMGGGLPVGRLTEMFGEPSSGKSLVAAQIAAVAQEEGYIVAYADTETAVSKAMMAKIGVNIDELIYASPDTIQEVFDFFEKTLDTIAEVAPDKLVVMIWDSVAATSSKAEMEKEWGNVGYLDHARIISQSLRKFTRRISKEQVALLFLNQTREKLGVLFGDKIATFGGKAVSFHSSVRVQLDLMNKLKVKDGKRAKIVGMNTRAVVIKNKVAMPFKDTMLPIYFGNAIDDPLASYNWLLANGYITGSAVKTLNIGNIELKFKKTTWRRLYDKHFDVIANAMLDSIDSDVESVEQEESEER